MQAGHLHPGTVPAILAASRRTKVVMPRSAAAHAHALGIAYRRVVATSLRFGPYPIYHAGDGVPYARLTERLHPYNVTCSSAARAWSIPGE